MKSVLKCLVLTALIVMCAFQNVQAAGYGLYEYSARGNALGGALIARTPDASTAVFNPANVTNLPGTHFQAGFTAINPYSTITFDDDKYGDATGKSNVWIPPHMYFTYQQGENLWINLATFSRFGLGTEFEEDWSGRYNVNYAGIETVSFSPSIAWKANDKLSLAIGPEFMWFKFRQEKVVDQNALKVKHGIAPSADGVYNPSTYGSDFDSALEGDSLGMGLMLAMHYQYNDDLAFGLTYRSQVKQEVNGEVSFSYDDATMDNNLKPLLKTANAGATIILPDEIFAGVSYNVTDRLSVEADLVWTNWSLYNELNIENEDVPALSTSSTKDYNDTIRVQLGAEYQYNDWLTLRGGYVFDQSPIEDEYAEYLLPTGDRHLFSAGTGFRFDEHWTLDLSYTYLVAEERHFDERKAEAIYDSKGHNTFTHLVGVTVGYDF
ncbi:OmpP1/FadL family transporter [Desulfobaculum sp. SPO524]|uniref:OmpP1/FadL family transporter n=1 Tax=Desulfobaculum sp. SPO524 TaxID=3378071 RepID=UPI003851DCD2